MIIGNFKKGDDSSFKGTIHTLTLNLEVSIEPVASKKSDKAPDYRVTSVKSRPTVTPFSRPMLTPRVL